MTDFNPEKLRGLVEKLEQAKSAAWKHQAIVLTFDEVDDALAILRAAPPEPSAPIQSRSQYKRLTMQGAHDPERRRDTPEPDARLRGLVEKHQMKPRAATTPYHEGYDAGRAEVADELDAILRGIR